MIEIIKPKCYIFDLDGTLNNNHGRYYHKGELTDFDTVNVGTREIYNILSIRTDIQLIIISGRSDSYLHETSDWLKSYELKYSELILKPAYSNQTAGDFKTGLLESLNEKYEILGVFDDQIKNVNRWRKMGFKCFDVAGNNFEKRFWRF